MTKKQHKGNLFRDPFGNIYYFKRILIFLIGVFSYNRHNGFNKLKVTGTEHLVDLPKNNVLFVSNHQTYFADVMAMYHVMCSINNGYINNIKNPIYLLNPKTDVYFVAAEETMNKGILAKLFAYAGAITIKRTWRAEGHDVNRKVDLNEIDNIALALQEGWVITFPQGTTTPWVPGRRGTAHLIKENKCIVIPVVIDGFRRSFDKKGLTVKKKGVEQTIQFKEPLVIDYKNNNKTQIMEKIMDGIEQSKKFLKVNPLDQVSTENDIKTANSSEKFFS